MANNGMIFWDKNGQPMIYIISELKFLRDEILLKEFKESIQNALKRNGLIADYVTLEELKLEKEQISSAGHGTKYNYE